jgi:hypothetical protein
VNATPLNSIRHSRARRLSARMSLRSLNPKFGITQDLFSIESYSCK